MTGALLEQRARIVAAGITPNPFIILLRDGET